MILKQGINSQLSLQVLLVCHNSTKILRTFSPDLKRRFLRQKPLATVAALLSARYSHAHPDKPWLHADSRRAGTHFVLI